MPWGHLIDLKVAKHSEKLTLNHTFQHHLLGVTWRILRKWIYNIRKKIKTFFIHVGKHRICLKLWLVCNNDCFFFFFFTPLTIWIWNFATMIVFPNLSNCTLYFSRINFISKGHCNAYFYWAIRVNLFNEALKCRNKNNLKKMPFMEKHPEF